LNFLLISSIRLSKYMNLHFVFLGNKKPTFLCDIVLPVIDRMEGNVIYFDVCRTKIPLWLIYGSIFLTMYSFEVGLRKMEEIFSNLLFI